METKGNARFSVGSTEVGCTVLDHLPIGENRGFVLLAEKVDDRGTSGSFKNRRVCVYQISADEGGRKQPLVVYEGENSLAVMDGVRGLEKPERIILLDRLFAGESAAISPILDQICAAKQTQA